MKRISPKRKIASRGSVVVETSVVFLVFFTMIIGAFDFGQFLFIHQSLVERARYAARYGTTPTDITTSPPTYPTSDQITNMMLYYQSTDPGNGTAGYLNLTSSMVTVTTTTDSVCSTSGAQPSLYKRLVVNVHDYPYVMISPYIGGSYTGPNITVGNPIMEDFSTTRSACP